MTDAKLTLYHTDDGQAEMFDTTKQNVSLYIKNILQEGEPKAIGRSGARPCSTTCT